MRRILPAALFIAGNFLLFLVLHSFFPKYHGFAIYIFVTLLMDLYLWSSVGRYIRSRKGTLKYLLLILFWIPSVILLALVSYAQFVSFIQWHVAFRGWIMSLFFMTFLTKSIALAFLLIADLLRIINGLCRRWKRTRPYIQIRRIPWLIRTGWIAGISIWILLLSGMFFWVYDFKVHETAIPVSNLPEGLRNFRIVQLSDLHLGSWTRKQALAEVTDIIQDLKPDVIVVTGDVFNFSSYEGYGFEHILSKWQGKYGTYCILGNHDYGDYVRWSDPFRKQQNMDLLEEYYKSVNWRLLRNESTLIICNNDTLVIAGLENWGAASRFQKKADLHHALKGLPENSSIVLLAHDPSYWERFIKNGPDNIPLTLSGHTHGGQFGIRTSWFQWSPVSMISNYWLGLYRSPDNIKPNRWLYVNPGLGTVGYSGRVGIRPEISLLILKPE